MRDISDVLRFFSPPLCTIERMEAQRGQLMPAETAFVDRWQAMRQGLPLPELDEWFALTAGLAHGPRPSHDSALRPETEGRTNGASPVDVPCEQMQDSALHCSPSPAQEATGPIGQAEEVQAYCANSDLKSDPKREEMLS